MARAAFLFLTTGDSKHAPSLDHVEKILDDADAQVAVNLVGVAMEDRPSLVSRILAIINAHRLQTGRPHWVVADEAHHLFPSECTVAQGILAGDGGSLVLVTVHPKHVSPEALTAINVFIAVGTEPRTVLAEFCAATGREIPSIPDGDPERGEALVWFVESGEPVARICTEPAHTVHERHKRKYAEGNLEEERDFYFRGPENKLRLRAHNLTMFLQIAEGVDEATWLCHLKQGDISKWFRFGLKDEELAGEIEGIEHNGSFAADQSRKQVAEAIGRKYTASE